ncbi:hypothetical protein ABTY53_11770 [Streptomyces noursei]|uniref:nSTAND3 domain-containing NTPase n=1 Tax=Streptomyces noursei TaxID=1971 RepID=UPI003326B600
MNERGTTRVDNPRGAMHTGYGDLYNLNVTIGPQDSTGRSPRRIADDQLRRLRQRFVDPAGMGEARRLLAEHSTVILSGEPGSGRTAAARVLLYEHPRETGIFRELLPGDDEEEATLTDATLVGVGDRLLLDLAEASETRWTKDRRDLSSLRKAVHEQHAHLVVIMPYGDDLESELQFFRADIARPPAEEVLRRHLRLHGVPHEAFLQPAPAMAEFLGEQRPVAEVADFADRVRRARAADPGAGFARWCEQARDARKTRRKEVARLVAKKCEASQRALLFTTAMLHGAHSDVIHRATDVLLHLPGGPREEVPSLACKDLAERLEDICASIGTDGHVRFDTLDYDDAVRIHFWDHMPHLRPLFSSWTARSSKLDDPHLTPNLREELVSRLADQYLRTGQWQEVAALADEWTAGARSRALVPAAVHVLSRGLEHEEYGSAFRHLIYTWCRYKQLTRELADVLRTVCTNVIAPTHPDQAMFRLLHLARREHGTTPALDALCALVATSSRLRRRALDCVTRQSSAPAADAHLFLRICDPGPLTEPGGAPHALVDEKYVQENVSLGWHAVLTHLPQPAWRPHAKRWLHVASDSDDRRDLLLDLLVHGAGGKGTHFAALYAVARAAEPTTSGGPARGAATTDRLLRKISAAQGLRPPAASSRSASPGGTTP